ncbi:MAG: multidrug efflux MFS transporter [Armatimonadetes bacterium]|nr:multidrug efflux MFS transporter [Armatimonadota bacterium]
MAATGAMQRSAPTSEVSPYRWIILIGLITAAIMEVLDTTIVNVSLPQIAGNLGATSEEIGWVSTGYILSNVIVLPVTAWLSSRFGRRRYLAASITLFTAASVMCGLSGSLGALVFWRIMQGAGGAALLSTAQATIREIFPPEELSITQSIYVLGIIVAPTLGPTLGGWITDHYSWHWAFLINLPIGIVSFFMVTSFLEDSRYRMPTGKVDFLGLALLAIGLGSLQYMLEEGNSKNWFESSTIISCGLVTAITLPLFCWWQLSKRNEVPIMNLRVLRNPQLSAALILFVVLGFGLYGGIFIYPLFAQNVLHLTPTITGLALLPGGIATGVSALMTGRLMGLKGQPIPPKLIIVTGLLIFLLSLIWLSNLPPTSSAADAQAALLLRGFGLGMLFIPINLVAFSTLKGAEIAQGSSLINLARQLGGSFGIAVLATYLTTRVTVAQQAVAAHVDKGLPQVNYQYQMFQQYLMTKGYSPTLAAQASNEILLQRVRAQATALAFGNCFTLIALAVVVSAPAILLLRNPKPRPAVPVDAH